MKIGTVKEILTSGYWLIASLIGAFFSFFALNRGGVVVFIEAGACFVLLNLITGQYRVRQIPLRYWITLAICGYLIVFGFLFASHNVKTKYFEYLIRMLFIAFTIHCLSLKKIDTRVYKFLPIVWCLSICWQLAAIKFFNMPFGTYNNPHYLANFLISTLPLIVFSFWTAEGWYKWIFVLFALLDVELLLKTGSRPAILGLTFSSLFILVFFIKSRIRWVGFLAIVLSSGILCLTNYGGVAEHLEELIVNLRTEERIYFWKSALQMLGNNNTIDWIFGNGIGGYRAIYADYSAPQLEQYFFPHLHPLGILYDNGIIGLSLVFGGLMTLLVLIVKTLRSKIGKNISTLLKCMLVIFLCWMIHSSLTFPFYSKYAQYPLGFILGTLLVLIEGKSSQSRQIKNKHI
jgi:hypothetical protein